MGGRSGDNETFWCGPGDFLLAIYHAGRGLQNEG